MRSERAIARARRLWAPYRPYAVHWTGEDGRIVAVAEVDLHDNVYRGVGTGDTVEDAEQSALADLAAQWKPFHRYPVRHDRPWPEIPPDAGPPNYI